MGHTNVSGTGSTPFRQNRWAQLAIGIVCMGLVANLQYAWTLFVVPMDAKHHWGQAAIQTAFSIFIVTETWLVPIEGWLVDKFGPRPVVMGGAACAALGWILDGYAPNLPVLYLAGVISGIGAGCVYGTCVGNALKWFPDRRGLAAGLTAMGFGAGSSLSIVPIAAMIKSSGYQHTFLYFGIGQGLALFILAWFLIQPSGDIAASLARAAQAAAPIRRPTRKEFNPRQMLLTPVFWVMYVMFVMMA